MLKFNGGLITAEREMPDNKKYSTIGTYEMYQKFLTGHGDGSVEEAVLNFERFWNKEANGSKSEICTIAYVQDSVRAVNSGHMVDIKAKFNILFTNDQVDIIVFSLPRMDKNNIIKKGRQNLAFINALVQSYSCSYSKGVLKVICENYSLAIKHKPAGDVVELNNIKVELVELYVKLALDIGMSLEDLQSYLDSAVTIRGQDKFIAEVDYCYKMISRHSDAVAKIVDYLNDECTIIKSRNDLNEILSFKFRAMGKTIAVDTKLRSGEVIPAGTIIDESVLTSLNKNAVASINIADTNTYDGMYLAEDVHVTNVPKGTYMIDQFKERFPDVKGSYLPFDYDDGVIILPKWSLIGPRTFEVLRACGSSTIFISATKNSASKTEVNKYYTVTNNNCFRGHYFDSNSEWVMNVDGNISAVSPSITLYDLVAIQTLMPSDAVENITDRDLGLRKNVVTIDKAMLQCIDRGIRDTFKGIKAGLFRTLSISGKSDKDQFAKAANKFSMFYSSIMSQLINESRVLQEADYTNPLAQLSSTNRVSTLVKNSTAVSEGQRRLSMHHFGRICPYETPESQKLGLTGTAALGLKIVDGKMTTPYYRVHHSGGRHFVDMADIVYFTPEDEESYVISGLMNFTYKKVSDKVYDMFSDSVVIARVPEMFGNERSVLKTVKVDDVQFIETGSNNSLSITAATIFGQGANDAVRVSFGTKMGKQAKGLVNPELALVTTSAWRAVPDLNADIVRYEGEPTTVSDIEYMPFETRIVFDRGPFNTGGGAPYVSKYNFYKSKAATITWSTDLKVGDTVKEGDILFYNNFTKDGELALGVNCLIAFMPVSHNYEDAVYFSEKSISKFTSYNTSYTEYPRSMSDKVSKVNSENYISPGDTIFTWKSRQSNRQCKSIKESGHVIHVTPTADKGRPIFEVEMVSSDYLQVGDKLANRHGNKGITPEFAKASKMPRLNNGMAVDICYNPMGVVSRMNLGQVLECILGLACKVLGVRIVSDAYNGATNEEIYALMSYAYDVANTDDPKSVKSNHPLIPNELHEFVINNSLSQARMWKGVFDREGKAFVYDPNTGRQTKTKVIIGYNYIYKLVQESAKGIHARGGLLTSKYSAVNAAPTRGAADGGGQRMGTMEVDALLAYGANDFINEMFHVRGDDPIARNNYVAKLLNRKDLIIDEPSMRRSTEQFLSIIEALGFIVDIDGVDFSQKTVGKRTPNQKSAFYRNVAKIDEDETEVASGTGEIKAEDVFASLDDL